MKILLSAFDGEYNSSYAFVNSLKIDGAIKLILQNDFFQSEHQIVEALFNIKPDIYLGFGQKPVVNRIYLETKAKNGGSKFITNFDYTPITKMLINGNTPYKISDNAGNYLCNHVYFNAMKFVSDNNINCKCFFIHTPVMKKFTSFDDVKMIIEKVLSV